MLPERLLKQEQLQKAWAARLVVDSSSAGLRTDPVLPSSASGGAKITTLPPKIWSAPQLEQIWLVLSVSSQFHHTAVLGHNFVLETGCFCLGPLNFTKGICTPAEVGSFLQGVVCTSALPTIYIKLHNLPHYMGNAIIIIFNCYDFSAKTCPQCCNCCTINTFQFFSLHLLTPFSSTCSSPFWNSTTAHP